MRAVPFPKGAAVRGGAGGAECGRSLHPPDIPRRIGEGRTPPRGGGGAAKSYGIVSLPVV